MTDADDTDAPGADAAPAPSDAGALDLEAMDEIRPGAWMAPGDQVVVSERLIEGLWFSHQITEHELVAGWLTVVPDFAPLGAFAGSYATADGGEVRVVHPGGDERVPHTTAGAVLLGPDGWLDAGFADGFVLVSIDGSAITLRWEQREGPAGADGAPVNAVFEALGNGAAVSMSDLCLHLVIRAPELFGPTSPPLGDRLRAAGLVATGSMVAREGGAAPTEADRAPALPGLKMQSAVAAQHLLRAVLEQRESDDDANDDEVVLAALADGDAVSAVAEQIVGAGLAPADAVTRLLDRVPLTAFDATRAGVGFLRSRLAEWRGDVGAEETALMASIHMVEQPAALVDAAWFASDRGDARTALALLREAGVPADDPEVALLRSFTLAGPHSVGRNEPCWCGSGRKHKHCCLRLNGHGLETRARWLNAKAVTFLQRPPQRAAMLSIAVAHAGVASPEQSPDRVIAAACDATVGELSLFDAGIFERFLEQRGRLLPDDELELAQSWAGARHALWHVLDGRTALRDERRGIDVKLDAHSAAKLPAGDVVLAVLREGPIALPGPVLPIPASAVDELSALIDGGSATALAARIGVEFGWTASPDVSFARRGAGNAAAMR